MKVRILTCLGLAIALIAAMNTRASAEQPSRQTLDAMGLGSLSLMSDDDALAVRGFGYRGSKSSAKAWGQSWANIAVPGGSAGSKNGYSASGKHSASGRNLSFAGVTIIHISSHGGKNGHDGHDGGGGGAAGARMGNNGHNNGGHNNGGHGGKTKISVTTIKVFAGGSSSARAH
jgi:hypothetical protein